MKLTLQELQALETEMLKEVVEICERHNINYYLAYGTLLGAIRHKGPIPWDYDVDIALPDNQLSKFIRVIREEISDKFYLDYHDTNKSYVMPFPRIGLKGFSTKVLHIDVYRIIGAPADKKNQELLKNQATAFKNKIQYKSLSEGYFAFNKISLKSKLMIYLRAFQMLFISKRKLLKNFEKICGQYDYEDSEITVNIGGGYGMLEYIPKEFYGKASTTEYAGFQVRIPQLSEKYLKHFYGDFMQFPSKKEQSIKDFFHITKSNSF